MLWKAWGLSLALAAGSSAYAQTADTGPVDTGVPLSTADNDGDGFSPADGDCDDDEPTAFPGNPEICEDRIDNDCNRLFDEGCDSRIYQASLRGGGGCTGGSGVGNTAALFFPLWLLVRRRRA
jgi:hypothetical protein